MSASGCGRHARSGCTLAPCHQGARGAVAGAPRLRVRVHVLLQVHIQELKHQVQLALLVHHILQAAGGGAAGDDRGGTRA